VRFVRGESRRYRSVMRRADGLEVELEGGSYNRVGGPAGEVPHDLAHLIVEDEFGLTEGVWGVLAAGGMFGHARVVSGRRAPHAGRRGREVVAESRERVMQAEMLTRAVCDACAGAPAADTTVIRRTLGKRSWSDAVTAAALERCRERLQEAGARWAALAPGEALEASWPHAAPPGRRRR
jgi:hypothetical protein